DKAEIDGAGHHDQTNEQRPEDGLEREAVLKERLLLAGRVLDTISGGSDVVAVPVPLLALYLFASVDRFFHVWCILTVRWLGCAGGAASGAGVSPAAAVGAACSSAK